MNILFATQETVMRWQFAGLRAFAACKANDASITFSATVPDSL